MSRSWRWLTGGLLGLGLTIGCKHTQPQTSCEECSAGTATPAPTSALPAPPQRLSLVPPPAQPAPAAPTAVPVNPPPTRAIPSRLPAVTGEPVAPAPTVNPEQSAPPVSPRGVSKSDAAAKSAPASPVNVAAKAPSPRPAVPAPTSAAPSGSAAPQYYNSPDYTILFGVLDYNARRGTWRLRYADAGEEDRYGGSVTLDDVGRQMAGYTSGDYVRVEGGFVNPESTGPSPAYRVKEMRPANGSK